jgi:hypothetical protein
VRLLLLLLLLLVRSICTSSPLNHNAIRSHTLR